MYLKKFQSTFLFTDLSTPFFFCISFFSNGHIKREFETKTKWVLNESILVFFATSRFTIFFTCNDTCLKSQHNLFYCGRKSHFYLIRITIAEMCWIRDHSFKGDEIWGKLFLDQTTKISFNFFVCFEVLKFYNVWK